MFRSSVMAAVCMAALCSASYAQPSGKAIFEGKGNCHVCHGRNARGTPLAPDLTDTVWINIDGTLAAIRAVVESGVAKPLKYSAPMPPMGGAKLKPEEMDAVAAYVFGISHTAVKDESGGVARESAPVEARRDRGRQQ